MTSQRSLEDWLAHIQTVHFRSIDMTLDRVEVVLSRLAPAPAFKVVAVAGTNGKGSCAAMLGSVLQAAGYRVGVYTSPHLVHFNERIQAPGPATDDELCRAFADVEALRGDIPLTYFEFATLAAVHVFERRAVDIAVMEVGMGGRLDAVNALPVDASLITNVELDHMQWLGKDRETIGCEKAHIMRAGRTAVYGGTRLPDSVRDYASHIGARLLVAGRDYGYRATGSGWRWSGPGGEDWVLEAPPIPGPEQVANAAAVLALLTAWDAVHIDNAAAQRGLRGARIRARCEIVARRPMVVVDVAHNPSAVASLTRHLAANPVSGKTTAVFGMLRDKDPAAVVRAMGPWVDAWCLATIRDERGQDAQALAESIAGLVRGPVHCHTGAAEAYDCALGQSGGEDRVLAFGSFHIAGDILAHMTRPS